MFESHPRQLRVFLQKEASCNVAKLHVCLSFMYILVIVRTLTCVEHKACRKGKKKQNKGRTHITRPHTKATWHRKIGRDKCIVVNLQVCQGVYYNAAEELKDISSSRLSVLAPSWTRLPIPTPLLCRMDMTTSKTT